MSIYIQSKKPKKGISLYAQARAIIDARNKAEGERDAELNRPVSVAAMMLGRQRKYEINIKF